MGNGCCAAPKPGYKRTLSRIFQSYKSVKEDAPAQEGDDPKPKKPQKASLQKLKRIEKFVETQGKRELIFFLENKHRECQGAAGQLYSTVVDDRTRLTHKLISISLFRELMKYKFNISGERQFKAAAEGYIVAIIDKFAESSKFSLKLASLKLLRDYVPLPLMISKHVPKSLERLIRKELDEKQTDVQTVNFEILLNVSRQLSNPSYIELHRVMIDAILHLLGQKIWPMEMWGPDGFFYQGGTARKRSESARSSTHQVSGQHGEASLENIKSKRKVELLDIFFEALSNVGHHIDNHIRDSKYFAQQLLGFFDRNHWELKPLISHVLKSAVFFQGTSGPSQSVIESQEEFEFPDLGLINVNILDQCLLGLRKILQEDADQFEKDLGVVRGVPDEFIKRHLTKIEIYYEVLSIETSNMSTVITPFLKTEERKLIELLVATFLMASLLEARKEDPADPRGVGASLLVNRLNLRAKSPFLENYEVEYSFLVNFLKTLLHRVSDVSAAIELTARGLETLNRTLPLMDKDIDSSLNLTLIYFEQFVSVMVKLVSSENYLISDAQSVSILTPLMQLGLRMSHQGRLVKLIEKYLKHVEFRGHQESEQKILIGLLYNYQLLDSLHGQRRADSDKTMVTLFSSSITMLHHIFSQYQGSTFLPEMVLGLLNSLDAMRLTLSLKLQSRILYATAMAFVLYNAQSYLKGQVDMRSFRDKEFLVKLKEIKDQHLRKALFTFIKQFETGDLQQKHSKDYLRIICDQTVDTPNVLKSPLLDEDLFSFHTLRQRLSVIRVNNNEQRLLTTSLHQIIQRTFNIEREVTLRSVLEAYGNKHQDDRLTGVRKEPEMLVDVIEAAAPSTPRRGGQIADDSPSVLSFTVISEDTARPVPNAEKIQNLLAP